MKDFDLGDMVFVAKGHASHHRVDVTKMSVIRVPEDVLPQDAVYVRFCAVSMATLRTTVARPGDGVAIFGLGVVGTMAAQIYQVSGYEVIGIDPLDARCKQAECCGVRHIHCFQAKTCLDNGLERLGGHALQVSTGAIGTPHTPLMPPCNLRLRAQKLC